MESMLLDTWKCCGKAALAMKQPVLAFQSLSKALEKDPSNFSVIVLLYQTYWEQPDSSLNVIDLLTNALNSNGSLANEYRFWFLLSLSYYNLNKIGESLQSIQNATSLKPNCPFLWVLQTKILLKLTLLEPQQMLEHLIPHFIRSIEISKTDNDLLMELESHISLAQLYFSFEKFSQSLIELSISLKIFDSLKFKYPKKLFADRLSFLHIFMGIIQFRLDKTDESVQFLNDSLSSLHSTRHIQSTMIVLSQVAQSDIHNTHLLISCINALTNELITFQRFQPCLHHELSNNQFLLNYTLARLYSKNNESEKSYSYFHNALKFDNTSPMIWLSIGSLYLTTGQLHDSLSAYSQAIHFSMKGEALAGDDSSYSTSLPLYLTAKFNQIFAAYAWLGTSQVYRHTLQIQDSLNALTQAMNLFRSLGDTPMSKMIDQLASELVHQIPPHGEDIYNKSDMKDILVAPDLPINLLLEFSFHHFESKSLVEDPFNDALIDKILPPEKFSESNTDMNNISYLPISNVSTFRPSGNLMHNNLNIGNIGGVSHILSNTNPHAFASSNQSSIIHNTPYVPYSEEYSSNTNHPGYNFPLPLRPHPDTLNAVASNNSPRENVAPLTYPAPLLGTTPAIVQKNSFSGTHPTK